MIIERNDKKYLDINTITKCYNDTYENIYYHLTKNDIKKLKIGSSNFYELKDIENLFNRIIVFRSENLKLSKNKRIENV